MSLTHPHVKFDKNPFATTTPPRKLQTNLVLLQGNSLPFAGVNRGNLVALVGDNTPAALLANAFPPPSLDRQSEAWRLAALRDEFGVRQLVISTELLARIHAVEATPWRRNITSGEGATVELVDGRDPLGNPALTVLAMPTVSFADLQEAVASTRTTLDLDPQNAWRYEAVAPMPELLLALAVAPLSTQVITDGAGTPASPMVRVNATCQVLDAAIQFQSCLVHLLKHRMAVPRPDDDRLPDGVRITETVIPTPAYFAYPAGHTTLGAMMTELLVSLLCQGAVAEQSVRPALANLTQLLGALRVNAGIHTDLDVAAGIELGRRLGDWLIRMADPAADCPAWAQTFASARAEWR